MGQKKKALGCSNFNGGDKKGKRGKQQGNNKEEMEADDIYDYCFGGGYDLKAHLNKQVHEKCMKKVNMFCIQPIYIFQRDVY